MSLLVFNVTVTKTRSVKWVSAVNSGYFP
jgi:hypothetical protein